MFHRGAIPLEPLEHRAFEVVARARGRSLVLWPAGHPERSLPTAVSSFVHLPDLEKLAGTYDTVVSVGQLGMAPDLTHVLADLRPHLGPDSVLHFCEPTVASDEPTSEPPHDVTGTLWGMGFTVFECRRFRARHRLRTYEYCWGRARLTPDF